jgi:hypothetical protein
MKATKLDSSDICSWLYQIVLQFTKKLKNKENKIIAINIA